MNVGLAITGFLIIFVMLLLIMTKKVSTLLSLILVPIIGFLIAKLAGFVTNNSNLSDLIIEGLKNIAPTGVMFIFAILFFGVLTDAGTFDPIINRIVKMVGSDPVKLVVGTYLLASLVHLDGSGAVTFTIVIPAMIGIYKRLGISMGALATSAALGAGIMNMLPWGGPTLRAISALNSTVDDVFMPMLVPMITGYVVGIFLCIKLGRQEKNSSSLESSAEDVKGSDGGNIDEFEESLKRPNNFIINIILIVISIIIMIKSILPPAVVFMIAFSLAMLLNYGKDVSLQSKIVDKHAESAMLMASMLFAAGSFTGILNGSGMLEAMSNALVALIPQSLGRFIPLIIGLLAYPLSFVFDPDSFYFGVLPVLAQTVEAYGISGVSVARSAIAGQMTIGFPISPLTGATFLLIGLAGVDLGDHQKKTFPYGYLMSLVIVAVGVIVGAIPI